MVLARRDLRVESSISRDGLLQRLSGKKELLQKELALRVPAFAREFPQDWDTHADLVARLPDETVFVDLFQYHYFGQTGTGRAGTTTMPIRSYVAFLLRPNQPVLRVELGEASPIDEAVRTWREDIEVGRDNSAAETLRRLVWEPLERHFLPGTNSVVLCPDGALTRIAWAAIPGNEKSSFLIEKFAIVVVPYGQFLLDRLVADTQEVTSDGLLLAVGDVSYDEQPKTDSKAVRLATRPAARGDQQNRWLPLPGTQRELRELEKTVGNRPVLKLSGNGATMSRVVSELPQVRWAHIATHGFFSEPDVRSALQLNENALQWRPFSPFSFGPERATVTGRNPLLLSGLVLAGANLPLSNDEFEIPQGDGGILTAEAIAGLPLQNLELVVLSACDTGLGEVAGGEGVFGLQRAFHMAGAHDVVGSLWKVDDEATQQLMAVFYNNLWPKNMEPVEALRQAQIAILNRGSSTSVDRGAGGVRDVPVQLRTERTHPRYWAGWVLSGAPAHSSYILKEYKEASRRRGAIHVARNDSWGWGLVYAIIIALGVLVFALYWSRRRA
jgi:CHAT domain-containing protein